MPPPALPFDVLGSIISFFVQFSLPISGLYVSSVRELFGELIDDNVNEIFPDEAIVLLKTGFRMIRKWEMQLREILSNEISHEEINKLKVIINEKPIFEFTKKKLFQDMVRTTICKFVPNEGFVLHPTCCNVPGEYLLSLVPIDINTSRNRNINTNELLNVLKQKEFFNNFWDYFDSNLMWKGSFIDTVYFFLFFSQHIVSKTIPEFTKSLRTTGSIKKRNVLQAHTSIALDELSKERQKIRDYLKKYCLAVKKAFFIRWTLISNKPTISTTDVLFFCRHVLSLYIHCYKIANRKGEVILKGLLDIFHNGCLEYWEYCYITLVKTRYKLKIKSEKTLDKCVLNALGKKSKFALVCQSQLVFELMDAMCVYYNQYNFRLELSRVMSKTPDELEGFMNIIEEKWHTQYCAFNDLFTSGYKPTNRYLTIIKALTNFRPKLFFHFMKSLYGLQFEDDHLLTIFDDFSPSNKLEMSKYTAINLWIMFYANSKTQLTVFENPAQMRII
eukprot:Pgem_evm1s18016